MSTSEPHNNEAGGRTSGLFAHRVAWVASGLRRAAASQGVELPLEYARSVAADGLRFGHELAVTRLGQGVVIRAQPRSEKQLPVLVGYAEPSTQWYRDGSRHLASSSGGPEAQAEAVRL